MPSSGLLRAQILALQADLKAVLARLNMNRRNASKPPVGGQKGHLGSTLCQAQEVDAGVIHDTPKPCDACKRKLPAASVVQTHQVFGLPILKFEVTKHCAMQAVCRCGKVYKGVFPVGVNAGVQYGPRAQAAVKSCVLHADETGIRMAKSLHWLHRLATESLTWIGAHPRLGTEAFKSRAQRQQFKGVQASVPFTNNLAEQTVHRPKVKEKIPSCLRTRQGVKTYYVIRTWCAALQTQGVNIFDSLVAAFKGATPR
jgi:hypothetical protein